MIKKTSQTKTFLKIISYIVILTSLTGCGFEAVTTTDSNSSTSNTTSTSTSSSSSSTSQSSTTDTNTTISQTTTYVSEISLLKNSFANSVENWGISYSSACSVSFDATQNLNINGSILITSRAHNYDGPFLNITNLIEANKLYIIRGYLKQYTQDTDNYNLMAKINTATPQYRQLNKINVIDTNWNKFRGFAYFSQADIDAGIEIYLNSDTNKTSFYLDEFELATTNYDNTDNSSNIVKISSLNLVDTNGTTINLKGINITAYDDEDTNTNDSSADNFMNYSYYNYDKDDFKNIASMGFNVVRVNLWYRYFEDESSPYVYKEKGFEWLNTILSWAKEAGIYVMLDMHAPQGGGFQGPSNITPFWNTTSYQDRFKSLWREIARRYKNNSTVIAYDIINEPCANTQTEYLTLLNDTISQIRQIDSNHIINVENGFSTDNTPFILSSQTNILYDFHFYDPWDNFTNHSTSVYGTSGIDLVQMRTLFEDYTDYYSTNSVPFNVSEFGQKTALFTTKNSLNWVSDLIDLINEKNGNYFYFSYKGNEFSIYDNKYSFFENVDKNSALIELFKAKQ